MMATRMESEREGEGDDLKRKGMHGDNMMDESE